MASSTGELVKDSNISTHVLDTGIGIPAGNLKILLQQAVNATEFDGENELLWADIGTQVTDADGRARFAFDIQPGIYRMVFFTHAYFERSGTKHFYPKVEITFRMAEVHRHHHVPLLISPFGFSTYRGS